MAEYLQFGDSQNPPSTAPSRKQELPSPASISSGTHSDESPSSASPVSHTGEKMPENSKGEGDDREGFGNDIQYLLTVIGYAVGLGNIWRFPALAYENGGGAFLVPYLVCATTFGLPVIFMELAIGQYMRKGPSVAFRDYIPLLQGLGWVMGLVSYSFTLFYNVIIGWAGLYTLTILTGQISTISNCGNEWNINCSTNSTSSAAEQFFNNHILQRTDGFEDWGVLNWRALVSNTIFWALCCIGLMFGVKWLGRLSMVTATLPYLIIAALFVRGLTLDGARDGIDYYLLKPDWSKMYLLETWRQALSQICFSLSVGVGGLLSMSSYNKRSHNFFRDAVVIVAADSIMSVVGGVAVFSTLGFLAKMKGMTIEETVQSSLALAFIAYPEAVNQMPLPYIWGFFFFLMLLLLGVSTMFGFLMGMVTCLCDQFDACRRNRAWVIVILGAIGVAIGVLFSMGSGIYWFMIFNDFIGSLAVTISVITELIVINFIYGPFNFFDDVKAMRGRPRSVFHKIFGSSGYIMRFLVSVTAPLLVVVVMVATFYHERITAGSYTFPLWTEYVGWSLGLLPMVMLPALAIVNCVQFRTKGKRFSELFRVQPSHPSFARIQDSWNSPDGHTLIDSSSSEKQSASA